MRGLIAGIAALAIAACASSSVRERPSDFRDGLGPDLRVFFDDLCLEGAPEVRGRTLVGEVVKGVAGLALKSFGRFLEEVGSPEIETATGVRAAMFYDEVSKPPVLNPELRCIYVVRDGFQSKGFDRRAPEEIRQTWTRLGIYGTPSLFAMMRLDPAEDGSDHFKAVLLEFTSQRFARAGAEDGRDYVVFLEFVIPSGGRQFKVNDNGQIAFDPSGPFARGGFPLRGAQRGDYLRAADLKGIETGWLTGPPRDGSSSRRPVNVYVDVVELKRGNPFIADLGRFLQSSEVTRAAGEEAMAAIDQEGREKAEIAASVEAEKSERRLVHALETRLLELRGVLADSGAERSELLAAVQAAEDAASDIQLHTRQSGWRSAAPANLLDEAGTLVSQGRQRIAAP